MKKFLLSVLILFLFLYATNPSKADFVEYVDVFVSDEVNDLGVTSDSFIDNLIGSISGYITAQTFDIAFERIDRVFYSEFIVKGADINLKYIGIAKKFIPITESVDALNLNVTLAKEVDLGSDEKSLSEDYYSIYPFEVDDYSNIKVVFEYFSGPEIEMILMDSANFKKFENKMYDLMNVYEQIKLSPGENKEFNYQLKNGSYYLIIDNTDYGIVAPPMNLIDDNAAYRIEIVGK